MSAAEKTEPGLLVRLHAAYRANGDGQPCEDEPADILREQLPGLPDHIYAQLAEELGPEALEAARIERAEAMQSVLRAEQADVLKLILFRIYEAPKPRLSVGSLLLAVGIKPMGINSERDLARQQVVSPEHVSNEVEAWQDLLQLPRTEFQKSESAVQAARDHNRRRQSIAA
ncbi:MAG: hypothetical protein RJA36_3829 [Pseudomonadota bacterium]|jgi:hypothetical protein